MLKIYVKNTFEMLICAKHNRIIVENDELNKVLRKIIDKWWSKIYHVITETNKNK